MSDGAIVMVDWGRFQHYKDRWPPWIKNYTALLADDGYLSLTGHRRSVLHGLWLAYAMSHGRLTDDTAMIGRRLNLKVTRNDLRVIEAAGFIRLLSQKEAESASAALDHRYQDASPRALAREETDKEKRFSRTKAGKPAIRIHLMIVNGAITERAVLDAELRGNNVPADQAADLIAELEQTLQALPSSQPISA